MNMVHGRLVVPLFLPASRDASFRGLGIRDARFTRLGIGIMYASFRGFLISFRLIKIAVISTFVSLIAAN